MATNGGKTLQNLVEFFETTVGGDAVKVTAVSTTGFAKGAQDYARQEGIELREVASLDVEQSSWFGLSFVAKRDQLCELVIAIRKVGDGEE